MNVDTFALASELCNVVVHKHLLRDGVEPFSPAL